MGMAFGVLIVQAGLEWWWGPVFAAVIFAGSLEFLVLGLVTATAPLATIAGTAFLVNFRHAFYALSFPLHRVQGRGRRAYSTFALTDEAWALTSSSVAQGWSSRRIFALQSTFHLAWVSSVTVGGLAGNLIPDSVVGLDFAMSAFFLVLALEAFVVRRSAPLPIVALVCSLVSHLLFGDGMLPAAMGSFIFLVILDFYARRRRA
ncbi:branched-chain amino acid ABC transporter permease [Tessaracoccus rhinocerotis]|uniref:Branched-chain amino acid ABC transporter permease n=2 Tax=Tessaracoccus rhinocerotis TaxID=1689449 RepID=A0A553K6D6_9ACTN|nr:branched-chain amino acid ABC transporter permease [Tessaracoccus rhinocerotis]